MDAEQQRAEQDMLVSERIDALGRLAGGIAHDFNNLLTIISGYTGLVLGRIGDDDAQLRADVEAIGAAADEAGTLTQKLLAFSQEQQRSTQLAGFALSDTHLPSVPAKPRETEAAGPRTGAERILLVEDDSQVRELVLTILRQRGYEVHEAGSPDAALDLLGRESGYDLLLTDVVMPKMNGPELADLVVARHPEIKVLYISGYTGNARVATTAIAPGRAFVQKPFNAQALAAKVRSLLDSATAPATA